MDKTGDWDALVLRVMAEVMENTAFTEVRPDPADTLFQGEIRGVVLLVHDPVQGELRLLMAADLLRQLTATVYGSVLTEINQQTENDFLAELLNTIAGRLLGELLPPHRSFQLGLPEISQDSPACPNPPCRSWNFTIDDQPLTISLHGETLLALEPPAAAPPPRPTEPDADDWG